MEYLKEWTFENDETVVAAVPEFICAQDEEFFKKEILNLEQRNSHVREPCGLKGEIMTRVERGVLRGFGLWRGAKWREGRAAGPRGTRPNYPEAASSLLPPRENNESLPVKIDCDRRDYFMCRLAAAKVFIEVPRLWFRNPVRSMVRHALDGVVRPAAGRGTGTHGSSRSRASLLKITSKSIFDQIAVRISRLSGRMADNLRRNDHWVISERRHLAL
ncbi:hypothetical protein EVAR_14119_1 [Eumeta japonica]|uniref:Uncharacterized protein n=1 Tax=Eumeta variegata TaxID=151549 RepID=A0A4C1UPE2_EUMVA|nr:hypothetical protein EVAR_14119_1 [Eumeta japonica]